MLPEAMREQLGSLKWTEMEEFVDEFAARKSLLPPGGGVTRFLVDELHAKQIPFLVVSWFTMDGGISNSNRQLPAGA
jgi:hypothetical protein